MNKIKFRATKDQMIDIALNAINASAPIGLGILHYKEKEYTREDFLEQFPQFYDHGVVDIDYFHGRMVKFYVCKERDSELYVVRDAIRSEYQSFSHSYPTMKSLLMSVPGVEIIEDD